MPVETVDPIEPVETVDPVETVEPVVPVEPVQPVDQVTDPPEVEAVTTTTMAPTTTTVDYTSCADNGTRFIDGGNVPSDDPCKLCNCDAGIIICATKQCPSPPNAANCEALPVKEGKCCPEYICKKDVAIANRDALHAQVCLKSAKNTF